MIKFSTKGFDKLAKRIEESKKKLRQGRTEYLKFLLNEVDMEGRLRGNIKKLVYDDYEPTQYERTFDLLNSVRAKIENDKLYLYMDDEWLGQQPQARYTGYTRGYAPEAHDGEGYSTRVEEGHTYNNPNKSVRMEGAYFMKETYEQLLNDINSQRIEPGRILDPLRTNWGR
ncbi:MAG: hypothetical protein ACOCZ5_02350 [bacterium]